jgi:DNA replication protein DnaC
MKTKTCFTCEKEFTSFDSFAHVCPECEKIACQKRLDESKRKNRERIKASIPELYQRTDTTNARFNLAAWNKIKDHNLTAEKPWLGLSGIPGKCKTRIAYLYAQELILNKAIIHKGSRNEDWEKLPSFQFITSFALGVAVMNQYSNDFEVKNPAKKKLDSIFNCEILLIDDIGKGRLTPAVASELHALLSYRQDHLLPTVWTSNSPPEVIAAGLPRELVDDMAGAFAGRLVEMSTIFTFK